MVDDNKQVTVDIQPTSKILTPEQVQQTFLDAFNNFGVQLKALTDDLKAIEIITATGTTTANIESSGSDLTNIANGKVTNVTGELNILARTRLELDGDLLVVLPTKAAAQKVQKPTPDKITDMQGNEPIQVDTEILKLHKENVNMALQNLQFVYGKVMDIASKFVEGADKSNEIGRAHV